MLRIGSAVCALLLCCGVVLADEIVCKFKSVNSDMTQITVTIDKKDKTYTLDKDPLIIQDNNKATPIKGGLAKVKAGTDVTVLTDKKDNKVVVTTVKVKR